MDEFSSPTGIDWKGDIGVVNYGTDRNMVCLFYNKSVHSAGKSRIEGRPIYEDRVFVRIHPPGERFNIIDRPANDSDRRRFPQQWAAFQQQKQQTPEGTPIDLLYPDQPSVAAMLRANQVHTIEHCAQLSGPAIDKIGMGAQRFCNDAQKYLSMANQGIGAAQFRRELAERDQQLKIQAQQIEQLKAEVSRLTVQNGSGALEQMQALLAAAMGRPTMPDAGTVRSPVFDAATAQINATHSSGPVETKRRKREKP